jgi:NEDD8-activating enzyme E1 regulatory subunit
MEISGKFTFVTFSI